MCAAILGLISAGCKENLFAAEVRFYAAALKGGIMDIYSYLNSRDVAAHCREINHSFNVVEQAFIIYECKRISIEEKLQLMQEIMDTMPDVQVSETAPYLWRYNNTYKMPDSFYAHLSKYVEEERKRLEHFLSSEPNSIYNITLHRYDWKKEFNSTLLHSSFDAARAELIEEYGNYGDGDDITTYVGDVSKRYIDSDRYITADVNLNGEITAIYDRERHYDVFDDIWVQIPVPFKKGDLVMTYERDPLVLNSVCYWETKKRTPERIKHLIAGWSRVDMIAYGYWLEENGKLFCECTHSYHNLEYYRGEIKGDLRLLKALSAHTKGEIDTEMLLFAFDAIQREHAMIETFPSWDFADEYYAKAGVADLCVKRRLCKSVDEGVTKMMRGVFWLIDGQLHAYPFDGSYPEGTAKSGVTYNHKKLWELVKPKGCNHPFDWFPRGRVELTDRDKAVIYMSPHIKEDCVYEIMEKFGLTSKPVIRYDYSKHYHCHLDGPEK